MRDSMVIYRSFLEAFQELDPNDGYELMLALMKYAMNDEEPELTGVAKAMFMVMRPLVDNNNTRYRNGLKGGRKKTEIEPNNNLNETKQQPNNNLTTTHVNDNDNEHDNENVNVNENENDNNLKVVKKRFTPPTLDEVKDYIWQQGYNINAESFISYYQSNGWKVGRNPMKDWKAAVRQWSVRDKEQKKVSNGNDWISRRVSEVDNW